MMINLELKPCAACGARPTVVADLDRKGVLKGYYVECQNYYCPKIEADVTPYAFVPEAIEAWNKAQDEQQD